MWDEKDDPCQIKNPCYTVRMYVLISFILAILPSLFLVRYYYKQDRLKPEPKGLIIKIFLLGIAGTFPAIILELVISGLAAQNMTGYQIMEQALTRSSWDDMQADMQLVLRNARGEQRVRDIAFYSSDDEHGLNRMLMRFMAPADVKGTSFLTLETSGEDDERYLYLPALRRVKKIASSGSGGNFMASDFTYYDIGMPNLEDWTYTLLGEEEKKGQVC